MKPIIKYRGGKSKELQQIIRQIPQYDGRYIEPFFGGGALFFHLEPDNAIINDINTKLITFYNEVKCNFNSLRNDLDEIEQLYRANRELYLRTKAENTEGKVEDKNEELYYNIRGMFNGVLPSEYSEAALYYFINKTAYSGMIRYNKRGGFNVPFGRYATLNTQFVSSAHNELLGRTEIYNCDYNRIFEMAQNNDFMFLDPPYDCVFSDYGNDEYKDGFDEQCHVDLSQKFRELRCQALLVIGKTPLTERLYGDMIVDEYAKTYAVNIRNRFKAAASHILVTNF